MTLLAQSKFSSVVSHHEVINKIKAFALAQSWTISVSQTSKQWADTGGGVYGWVAGNENFLEIQSSGFGSQTLNYRFRSRHELSDANHEWVDIGAQKSGETTISTADPTHPVFQNTLKGASFRSASFKPTSIPELWLFGSGIQIIVVARFDSAFVQVLYVGSTELFDQSTPETEGNFAGHSTDTSGGDGAKWYNYLTDPDKHFTPFDAGENLVLKDGVLKDSTEYECNIRFSETSQSVGGFSNMGRAVQVNNYSGKRVILKPICYVNQDSPGTFIPIGTLPIFRLIHPGLTIGQELDYSGEKYVCFPNMVLNQRQQGFAVRIL
jgi:hypothetical protein